MKRFTILSCWLLICLGPRFMHAQDIHEPCGTMHYLEMQRAANPAIDQKMEELERFTAEFVSPKSVS
ncbi:MAG: hypothetical protein AAF399_19635, partial [Bacteroidota bacterium]